MRIQKGIIGIAICILIFLFLLFLPWLNIMEGDTFIESPVDAVVREEGEICIVDKGGLRILFLNKDQKIERLITTKEEIKQIVESENKNLYIRTFAQIEKNGKIKREVIYKLGNTYGNKEPVYELVHETPVLRPQIIQLSGLGEGVRFAIRGEKQLTFYEVDSDSQQEMKEIGAVPFNDADLWIYRAEMTEDKTKAYYLLHNGKIYCYDFVKKEEELVYDGTQLKRRESIPKELVLGKDGTLYFSDLGFRDIGWIRGKETGFLYQTADLDKKEFLLRENYEAINAKNTLIGCTRYKVYFLRNDKPIAIEEVDFSFVAITGAMISKIALVLCTLVILYYLLGKGKYIFQKISLRIKVIISICFSMVIMGILLLVLMLPQYAELMAKELEKRAEDVGYLAAKQIPLKNLKALDSISDYRNDDYMKVKHVIDNIFLSESGRNDLYCVLYTIRDDVITVNYTSTEDSGCIYPYDWIYEGSEEQQILATGTPRTYSQLGSFEGSYTFSLTPIMGENGKAEGLIEVGVNARQFKEDIEKTLKEVTVGIILAAAITIFLVVQLFKLKEYQEKKDE